MLSADQVSAGCALGARSDQWPVTSGHWSSVRRPISRTRKLQLGSECRVVTFGNTGAIQQFCAQRSRCNCSGTDARKFLYESPNFTCVSRSSNGKANGRVACEEFGLVLAECWVTVHFVRRMEERLLGVCVCACARWLIRGKLHYTRRRKRRYQQQDESVRGWKLHYFINSSQAGMQWGRPQEKLFFSFFLPCRSGEGERGRERE